MALHIQRKARKHETICDQNFVVRATYLYTTLNIVWLQKLSYLVFLVLNCVQLDLAHSLFYYYDVLECSIATHNQLIETVSVQHKFWRPFGKFGK